MMILEIVQAQGYLSAYLQWFPIALSVIATLPLLLNVTITVIFFIYRCITIHSFLSQAFIEYVCGSGIKA